MIKLSSMLEPIMVLILEAKVVSIMITNYRPNSGTNCRTNRVSIKGPVAVLLKEPIVVSNEEHWVVPLKGPMVISIVVPIVAKLLVLNKSLQHLY